MLCLALMGCSSNQELAPDPTSITLFYGDTSISAGVLEDKTFSSVLADRVESVTFSGSIRKARLWLLRRYVSDSRKERATLDSTIKYFASYEARRVSGCWRRE